MTDSELCRYLDDRKALIVHFSHYANMRAGGEFPADLQAAIENADKWALSSCVVWAGHPMELPGDVGIIFEPCASNVVSVKNEDSGSSTTQDGDERSSGGPLTVESLGQTFNVVGRYNEWRVKGGTVRGIYVRSQSGLQAKRKQVIGGGPAPIEDISLVEVTLAEIHAAFPALRIYTHGSHGVHDITPD